MIRGEVTSPPKAQDAFERTDDPALLTQAACLLVLGLQLRGYGFGQPDVDEIIPEEDFAAIGFPRIPPESGRVDPQPIRLSLAARFGTSVASQVPPGEDVTWRTDIFAELARECFREPTPVRASYLMEACLRHPHELVRVAAATAFHTRSTEEKRLTDILLQGTRSADPLIRQLAATALARLSPDSARLRDFTTAAARAAGAVGSSHTAMLVHGTLALGASWWQPGGDFHSYLLQAVRPDLYKGSDRFAWSGGYSDGARALGAKDLVDWVNHHSEQGLDLFTHSHGGNLAMLASHKGLRIGELVLLSCPVHFAKYQPEFSQIGKVVSIRVRLDLIILADRGGQRFKHPRIRENVLPIWFSHSATHDPAVWKNSTYRIPAML
jgi:hypothetical protein